MGESAQYFSPRDRSKEVASEGVTIDEYVLMVPAGVKGIPGIDIVIFTSCTLLTGRTRPVAGDRVRICRRWRDGTTERWARVGRHNRTKNCLENVRDTITKDRHQDPSKYKWTTRDDALDE